MNLVELVSKVKSCDLIPKVSLSNFRDQNDAPTIRVISPKLSANSLFEIEEGGDPLSEYHKRLKENNEKFNQLMREAIVPLRFSFMALLTARKVTIFSAELTELMSWMIN
jgi:hypothetical protein